MKNRPLFYGCLVVFLTLSLCIYTGGAKFVNELRPSNLQRYGSDGDSVRILGQVYNIEQKSTYQIIYLKNNSFIYQNKSFEESKIIVYDEEKLNIEIGNMLSVTGSLSFFEKERNPGCFDQKLYYQKQDIHASVWADEIQIRNTNTQEIKNALYQLRGQWCEMICKRMGDDKGGILCAVLLAEKSGMDTEVKELYQVNGVAHILAISGLHLSVIGTGLYQFFRRISGSFFVGGIVGILFLLIYIVMIGMSVSVLRSLIMFLFRVGADMTGRHYDRLTAIMAAAVITLISKPLSLYDGAFWLSYGAILGITFILPMFEGLLCQAVWSSVSITLMTLPVTLYYFYEIPLYGPILNLVIVPLMSVLLMSGLAGSTSCLIFIPEGPFGENGIGGILLWMCRGIFWFYEKLCRLFLTFPHSRIVAGKPELWKIFLYYFCLVAAMVLFSKKKKKWLSAGIIGIAVILIIFPVQCGSEVQIAMLDVGQGDSIFVSGPTGQTYLIDGGSSDLNKISKYQIEPFLKAQGIQKLDYVFVSHGDEDHMNGIVEMIERMQVGVKIKTLVLPDKSVWDEKLKELAKLAINTNIQVVTISKGQRIREETLTFTCLTPAKKQESQEGEVDRNASSMVLALQYEGFDMLFTGDVEGEGEDLLEDVLQEKYKTWQWDVLKVAHHGSKNSTDQEFLDMVKPRYALISAGRENRYGHPHKETVERLERAGSKVISTQNAGAIMIVTDGKKMSVNGYVTE